MGKLFAAKLQERKGASHDNSSTTHDGGYATEESFSAYPRRIRATGLAVRTPFQSVTGTTCTTTPAQTLLAFLVTPRDSSIRSAATESPLALAIAFCSLRALAR